MEKKLRNVMSIDWIGLDLKKQIASICRKHIDIQLSIVLKQFTTLCEKRQILEFDS